MFFDRLPGTGYVCAHRGARALAPENTMMAAELALEFGADYWEMDVQRTSDGALVMFHDDVLSRTTNVAELSEFEGRAPWAVASFTLEELGRLDAGSWFAARDPYGTVAQGDVAQDQLERMKGTSIPTLSQALAFTKRNEFPINIEIKDQKQMIGDMSIVAEVLQAIQHMEAEDLVLISSFNHDYLVEMKRLAPRIPVAVLAEESPPSDVVSYLESLGASTYHPDKNLIDTDAVTALAGRGVHVVPWTVNNMDEALSLIEAGCFGVITDFTHSLRQLLSKDNALTEG